MIDHAALVIRNNNKILFIKRSEQKTTLPNIWSFPSGTKEETEDIKETVKREAYEELGVNVEVEDTLAIKELPEFGVRLHFITCNIPSGEPTIKEPKEISKIDWLTFNEFFDKFEDNQIGHGLIFLRQNPHIWKNFA